MLLPYKAWLKEEREIKDVRSIYFDGNDFLGIEGACVVVEGRCDLFEVDEEVELMQSTGSKDKNGVEIYTGHICWSDDFGGFGKIVFDKEHFIEFICDEENTLCCSLSFIADEIEVVGNIYENLDLL
ncbi:YopX family protein [Enterococcus hirae]